MFKSKYFQRVVIVLVCVVFIGLIAMIFFRPKDLGNHGSLFYKYFRLSAIDDEAMRPIKHFTNSNCKRCHKVEFELQFNSMHKTLSCEFCHGPGVNHVSNSGKLIGHLVKAKGNDINKQCLRCHNGKIIARVKNKNTIKTIIMPDHLKDKKVKLSHNCDQCHIVHAPLKNIKHLNKIFSMED